MGIVSTLLELIGAVAIGYGLWCIYPPGAWIWSGLAAFAASYSLELWCRDANQVFARQLGSKGRISGAPGTPLIAGSEEGGFR